MVSTVTRLVLSEDGEVFDVNNLEDDQRIFVKVTLNRPLSSEGDGEGTVATVHSSLSTIVICAVATHPLRSCEFFCAALFCCSRN